MCQAVSYRSVTVPLAVGPATQPGEAHSAVAPWVSGSADLRTEDGLPGALGLHGQKRTPLQRLSGGFTEINPVSTVMLRGKHGTAVLKCWAKGPSRDGEVERRAADRQGLGLCSGSHKNTLAPAFQNATLRKPFCQTQIGQEPQENASNSAPLPGPVPQQQATGSWPLR